MLSDEGFMGMALDLARLGVGRTSPNPAVGAVLVKDGKVIATGFHRGAGLPHAEIEAIRHAAATGASSLRGAALYVTLEPCCPPKPGGRTPPCTDSILSSGIREVVVGMRDPDPKVSGRGIRALKKAGVQVREGVLRMECEGLNEAYIKHRRHGLPFVILKAAMTSDGMVGRRNGMGRPAPALITGEEARTMGHHLRDRADAILVGVNTVISDNPELTTRIGRKRGRDPIRIVLDSSLRTPPKAKVLRVRSERPTWIATTVKSRLSDKKRVEVIRCRRDKYGRVDLTDLLRKLARRGVVTLLVEGGPTVWSSFIRQRQADKMTLFVAPLSLGKEGIPWIGRMPALRLKTTRLIGRDMMIEGYLGVSSHRQ